MGKACRSGVEKSALAAGFVFDLGAAGLDGFPMFAGHLVEPA